MREEVTYVEKGIVCAVEDSLTPGILESCGIYDRSRIVIAGAQDIPEFQNILQCKGHFNSRKLETDLVKIAKELVAGHPEIGALLIECSDMPPYAWAVQNAVQRPVFDYVTLINWVYQAVVRRPFSGYV